MMLSDPSIIDRSPQDDGVVVPLLFAVVVEVILQLSVVLINVIGADPGVIIVVWVDWLTVEGIS